MNFWNEVNFMFFGAITAECIICIKPKYILFDRAKNKDIFCPGADGA